MGVEGVRWTYLKLLLLVVMVMVILESTSVRGVPFGHGNDVSLSDKQPVGVKNELPAEGKDNELEPEEEIEENPGYFEGDIAGIDGNQLDGRNAIIDSAKTWTDGIIPYVMSSKFSSKERRSMESAFEEYRQKTCLNFVPRTNEPDFIVIIKGKGCYSQVGRKGIGGQEVSLGSGCLTRPGVVLHELMHVAGFWHEQSRADRDDYVTINWKNIRKGMEVNFSKYPWTEIQHLNETYDVTSVMHYGPYSFARNKLTKTIEPKDPSYDRLMGQRDGFSNSDVLKINKLYECDKKTNTGNRKLNKKKKEEKENKLKSFFTSLWQYLSKARNA